MYGRVDRLANEEVVLHLMKEKCLPVLLCGLELDVCPVNLSDMRSLEFTVKRTDYPLDHIDSVK